MHLAQLGSGTPYGALLGSSQCAGVGGLGPAHPSCPLQTPRTGGRICSQPPGPGGQQDLRSPHCLRLPLCALPDPWCPGGWGAPPTGTDPASPTWCPSLSLCSLFQSRPCRFPLVRPAASPAGCSSGSGESAAAGSPRHPPSPPVTPPPELTINLAAPPPPAAARLWGGKVGWLGGCMPWPLLSLRPLIIVWKGLVGGCPSTRARAPWPEGLPTILRRPESGGDLPELAHGENELSPLPTRSPGGQALSIPGLPPVQRAAQAACAGLGEPDPEQRGPGG